MLTLQAPVNRDSMPTMHLPPSLPADEPMPTKASRLSMSYMDALLYPLYLAFSTHAEKQEIHKLMDALHQVMVPNPEPFSETGVLRGLSVETYPGHLECIPPGGSKYIYTLSVLRPDDGTRPIQIRPALSSISPQEIEDHAKLYQLKAILLSFARGIHNNGEEINPSIDKSRLKNMIRAIDSEAELEITTYVVQPNREEKDEVMTRIVFVLRKGDIREEFAYIPIHVYVGSILANLLRETDVIVSKKLKCIIEDRREGTLSQADKVWISILVDLNDFYYRKDSEPLDLCGPLNRILNYLDPNSFTYDELVSQKDGNIYLTYSSVIPVAGSNGRNSFKLTDVSRRTHVLGDTGYIWLLAERRVEQVRNGSTTSAITIYPGLNKGVACIGDSKYTVDA